MILAVAATEFEMDPYLRAVGDASSKTFVCGIGVLESCLNLTRYLEKHLGDISAVFNFGVAGAYFGTPDKSPVLLDICMARKEIFGDLGICYPRRLDDLGDELKLKKNFQMDDNLTARATEIIKANGVPVFSGNFVTVSCVSGTRERGEILRRKYDGLCENMEGAAIARVCEEFSLPFVEMRCISNYVEDRDPTNWRLNEACERAGQLAALVVKKL